MESLVRILMVEDEPLQYELVSDILENENTPVKLTWASSYREGLAQMLEGSYDLCLLDYGLDEKNGLELLREARDGGCAVPAVFLTAEGGRDIDMSAMRAGAADYLVKAQITGDSLLRSIRYTLERARLSRERDIYCQAMQGAQQGVIILSPDGNILDVNHAFEQEFGYQADEIRGKHADILNPGMDTYEDLGVTPKQYAKLAKEQWEKLNDPGAGYWEGEVPRRRKDGSVFWAHLIIKAIFGPGGKPSAYFCMPLDITKRVEHEFQIRLECYRAISDLAEKRDNETGAHLKRISRYSSLVAEWMLLPKKFVQDIGVFAQLHDIGKVGIPDQILLAPRKLTPEEFEIMKTHSALGYEILKGRETLEMAADIAHHHHERWDGKGYPDKLAGEAIPLPARIVALVDVYDALRSARHYKPAWPHAEAKNCILESSSGHFDPTVAKGFAELEEKFRAIADSGQEVAV